MPVSSHAERGLDFGRYRTYDWAPADALPRTDERLRNFFFQAEDGIRAFTVTGVQTCALPIFDSVAVLPFVNAENRQDTEYLCDGITESLINHLSQIPKLRVVPRSTAFRYKGVEIDPERAARDRKSVV